VNRLDRTARLNIADIGSLNVNGDYRGLFNAPTWKYVGVDMNPGQNVDVVVDGETDWKNIEDQTFDLVISGQTMEHVRMPWIWMMEIRRILRRGGQAFIVAPHTHHEHNFPVDCWRVFPEGMKALMAWCGFYDVKTWKNSTDTVGWGKRP